MICSIVGGAQDRTASEYPSNASNKSSSILARLVNKPLGYYYLLLLFTIATTTTAAAAAATTVTTTNTTIVTTTIKQ